MDIEQEAAVYSMVPLWDPAGRDFAFVCGGHNE